MEDGDGDVEDDERYVPALPGDLEHVPMTYVRPAPEEMLERSSRFYDLMNARRTVRHFSSDRVPVEVIRNIVRTAGECTRMFCLVRLGNETRDLRER